MEMILTLPPVIHRSLWAYLSLFRGKNKLRSSKMLRIVKQLAPMIKAAQVERNRITYNVPAVSFARAMEYMVDRPPASLSLPLKGNGYLFSILANNAESALAKQEKKNEQEKRTPYRSVEAGSPPARKISKTMPEDFKAVASRINPAIKKRLNDDKTNIKEVNNEQASNS